VVGACTVADRRSGQEREGPGVYYKGRVAFSWGKNPHIASMPEVNISDSRSLLGGRKRRRYSLPSPLYTFHRMSKKMTCGGKAMEEELESSC